MSKKEEETAENIAGILVDSLGIEEKPQEKTVKVHRGRDRHFERRIKSELALEKELPWHFEKGEAYHCISFGDVDSLTYLRCIVKQQRIKYLLLSTWCMAITDAEEIKKWMDDGYIHRADFYVGEIFQGSYGPIYDFIKANCLQNGGRIAVFRNHSKVMAGFGEHFDFAIESSANINTNPRCENTVITVDTGLALFYKNFFDDIKAFNKDFPDWKPFDL